MKHSKEAIQTFSEALAGAIRMGNERGRAIALSDLLTDRQVREVLLIMTHEPDPIERVEKLKAYLQASDIQSHLTSKGVVPSYLAYLLEYHFGENLNKAKDSNGKS